MTLQEFLNENSIEGLEKEVIISPRFKDKNGTDLSFKIKAMSKSEFNELKKRATSIDKNGRAVVNEAVFSELCIIENTITPNFKDNESIKSLGCVNAAQYMNKVLLAGEAERLAGEILKLSGFGKNINELVKEAKN